MRKDTSGIELKGVTLQHGDNVLVERTDLSIPQHSLSLLLGQNGCGKTTLLRTIVGLHPLTKGSITLFGSPHLERRHQIGYLPQDRHLFAPQLSGRTLVTSAWRGGKFGLPNFGKKCRNAVDRALSLTHSLDLAKHPIGYLSSGERQRILIASALVDAPEILLFDEPLTGLDSRAKEEMTQLLISLRDKLALTILLSTHDTEPFRAAKPITLQVDRQNKAIRHV